MLINNILFNFILKRFYSELISKHLNLAISRYAFDPLSRKLYC